MIKKTIQLLALSCIIPPSLVTADVGQYIDQAGGVNVNVTTPEAYVFDSVSILSSDVTVNGSTFTVNKSGIYRINYQLNWESLEGNIRKEINTYIMKNGNTILAGSGAYANARKQGVEISGNASNGAHFYTRMNVGDYIELFYKKSTINTGYALTLPEESSLSLQLLTPDVSSTAGSCADILLATPSSLSGSYSIDPDGAGPIPSSDLYCDMTTDGGGWTLISKFSGASGSCSYGGEPACSIEQLSNSTADINAKLSHAAVYALVDNRTNVEFRAVSNTDDTVISRTDGGNAFDIVLNGNAYRCRDIDSTNWHSYTIINLPSSQNRVTTWTNGFGYVGHGDGVTQCGNGISYQSDHFYIQQIDSGYAGAGSSSPGVFYVR